MWAKVMAAEDIHKEKLPVYREHGLSHQAVHNWVQKFSEGQTSVEDERPVRSPLEIAMPAKNFTPQVSRDL
jgi:transposase-like protein